MARKKWSAKTEITPTLLRFREKRKWQIALRRYVLDKNPSPYYAPYFGLDIETIRKWFEIQFGTGIGWDEFGKKWQFDHIIPVTYFDFTQENELKLCWNFCNVHVEHLTVSKETGKRLDLLGAKAFFKELHEKTGFSVCLELLDKISSLEKAETTHTHKQQAFLLENKDYLDMLKNYSSFEFELLNTGRSPEEVKKEVAHFTKIIRP